MANFGVIAENEHGESELEELTGNDTGCEVHDNWWDEDPLEEIDEFAQQVRSLAEFRDMVRRMRVARGYYPISRSPSFEPNRSKGKGRTKDSKQSFHYLKGKDSRHKNSSCRPWSSENSKGPPQRDEGGRGLGTPLRRKHDDSMDIGGTISPEWVRGGPKGLLGGVRPPKRCFLCGAQPRTTHCPRPCDEGQSRSKERHWNGVNIDSHMHANGETTEMVYFSHDLCKGKLIVDSGDTKSVAGLRVFEDYHEDCHQHLSDTESALTGCVPCLPVANHLWVSRIRQITHCCTSPSCKMEHFPQASRWSSRCWPGS